MKATGIVRRIDELGRVVIPKEIRRTLRIREGDPLEIFTDRDGEVILKKYSPIGEMGEFARQFAESLHRTVGHIACISDRDSIIAVAGGSRKDFMDRPISPQIESIMTDRRGLQVSSRASGQPIPITSDDETGGEYTCQTIVPIVAEGEPIGSVILIDKEAEATMADTEMKVCQTAASFIGKQMEQ
jgi:AbrB family transcriptional regulator (stage V sporulation protein T)